MMKNIRDTFDFKHKKLHRWALLLLSSLLIIGASTLLYGKLVYEQPLNVGSTSGVATGSSSVVSGGVSFSSAMVVVVSASVLVISLGLFGFLSETFRRTSRAPGIGLASFLRYMIEDDREASSSREAMGEDRERQSV